jgi:hypothetical protein
MQSERVRATAVPCLRESYFGGCEAYLFTPFALAHESHHQPISCSIFHLASSPRDFRGYGINCRASKVNVFRSLVSSQADRRQVPALPAHELNLHVNRLDGSHQTGRPPASKSQFVLYTPNATNAAESFRDRRCRSSHSSRWTSLVISELSLFPFIHDVGC